MIHAYLLKTSMMVRRYLTPRLSSEKALMSTKSELRIWSIPFTCTLLLWKPYQHIWQWHGTFEDCQSVQTLGLGSVFDLYCPAGAVPWPGMHGHCLATWHTWCRISRMHTLAFDRVSLGHQRAGRIKGPRIAPNMLICELFLACAVLVLVDWSTFQHHHLP